MSGARNLRKALQTIESYCVALHRCRRCRQRRDFTRTWLNSKRPCQDDLYIHASLTFERRCELSQPIIVSLHDLHVWRSVELTLTPFFIKTGEYKTAVFKLNVRSPKAKREVSLSSRKRIVSDHFLAMLEDEFFVPLLFCWVALFQTAQSSLSSSVSWPVSSFSQSASNVGIYWLDQVVMVATNN